MSERNKLTVSPIAGDDALLLNGFKITSHVVKAPDGEYDVWYSVWRKGLQVGDYAYIQDAVKWCED